MRFLPIAICQQPHPTCAEKAYTYYNYEFFLAHTSTVPTRPHFVRKRGGATDSDLTIGSFRTGLRNAMNFTIAYRTIINSKQ